MSDGYGKFCDSDSGVYPPEEFEGLWVEHWSNGQLKYRGLFKRNQMRIGQHISFFETGVLHELSYWQDGWVVGTVMSFREDGSKEYERDYGEHGGVTRSWTEKYYSAASGALHSISVYRAEESIAEWMEPESRKLLDSLGIDKVVQDAVRMVYPDE
jgi:hypothetical protein